VPLLRGAVGFGPFRAVMGWLKNLLEAAAAKLEKELAVILAPTTNIPLLDVKFFVGIALWAGIWAYWLQHIRMDAAARRLAVSIYWTTALMVLGLDLAALSLLQQIQTQGFLGVFFMVMCNVLFTRFLFHGKDLEPPSPIEVHSLYEDVTSDFVQLVVVFTAQSCLFLYLFYASFVQYTDANDITYHFWVTAYLVQMSGMFKRGKDSQLGPTWNIERFSGMTHMNENVEYQAGEEWHSVAQWKMQVRRVMGFTVNTLYRDLIAFLVPIVLMQSDDAMDFVQNCFAVSYITQLDDMGDGKELVYRLRQGLAQPLLA